MGRINMQGGGWMDGLQVQSGLNYQELGHWRRPPPNVVSNPDLCTLQVIAHPAASTNFLTKQI